MKSPPSVRAGRVTVEERNPVSGVQVASGALRVQRDELVLLSSCLSSGFATRRQALKCVLSYLQRCIVPNNETGERGQLGTCVTLS